MTDLPPLNCNGCRKCCEGDVIPLVGIAEPGGDNPFAFDVVWAGGRYELRRGADGNCVNLGPAGCKIYGCQPKVCHDYDCRAHALFLMASQDPDRRVRGFAMPSVGEGLARLEAAGVPAERAEAPADRQVP